MMLQAAAELSLVLQLFKALSKDDDERSFLMGLHIVISAHSQVPHHMALLHFKESH